MRQRATKEINKKLTETQEGNENQIGCSDCDPDVVHRDGRFVVVVRDNEIRRFTLQTRSSYYVVFSTINFELRINKEDSVKK